MNKEAIYKKVFTKVHKGKNIDFYRGDDQGYYLRVGQIPGITHLILELQDKVVAVPQSQIVPMPHDKLPSYILTVFVNGDSELNEATRLFLKEIDIYEIARKVGSKEIEKFANFISTELVENG